MNKETYDKAHHLACSIDVTLEHAVGLRNFLKSNKTLSNLKDNNEYQLEMLMHHAELQANVKRSIELLEISLHLLETSGIKLDE
jgi:hypothetical protein